MVFQPLRFTDSGYIVITPGDDPRTVASLMDCISYQEDFCLALDFSPPFIASLMAAGFLVMSLIPEDEPGGEPILFPQMHLHRSVLFFDQLHESRSARRLLPRYELRAGGFAGAGDSALFDEILERCARFHGEGWLTPALRRSFHDLNSRVNGGPAAGEGPASGPRPAAFGLYREGRLLAGEFGCAAGRVYTSYSGYRDEDSSGTVQMILSGRWLRDSGFSFWDLGMVLP
ncbi:MAG: GNAT family N-acetyltransferase, partial [Treponema sp.]|nr:GNAT family N-acetyltransferase [Treponema sp.]